MSRLQCEWRLFWTAVTVLTRLPAPALPGYRGEWLAPSASYFPLVGLLVGALAAGVHQLAWRLWPGAVPAVFAVAVAALLTGGLHEDGWADLFDGLAAGREPSRMLEAMRDSRIGSLGALALALLLLAKVGAIRGLPEAVAVPALIAAHVLSRWSAAPLLRLPYAAAEGGLASTMAGRIPAARCWFGSALATLIVAWVLGWRAAPVLLAAAASTLAAGLLFRRRLGGISGDCLGAANQLVELVVLLVLAARWPAQP